MHLYLSFFFSYLFFFLFITMEQLVINPFLREEERMLCKDSEGWVRDQKYRKKDTSINSFFKGPFSNQRLPDFTPCFEDR